jgi:hypothetical protein
MPRSWFDFRIFIRVSNRIFLKFFVWVSSCSRIKQFDFRGSTVHGVIVQHYISCINIKFPDLILILFDVERLVHGISTSVILSHCICVWTRTPKFWTRQWISIQLSKTIIPLDSCVWRSLKDRI